MNKLFFFPQVAEQTIYFQKFAEQSFFSQKNHSPPPGIKWSAPKVGLGSLSRKMSTWLRTVSTLCAPGKCTGVYSP